MPKRVCLGLRAAERALCEGPQGWLEAGEDVLAFSRGSDLLVAVNFASEPRTARLGDGHAEVLAATGAGRAESTSTRSASHPTRRWSCGGMSARLSP